MIVDKELQCFHSRKKMLFQTNKEGLTVLCSVGKNKKRLEHERSSLSGYLMTTR